MSADPEPPDTTAGTLLGGRVSYRQPRTGFRTGIEPVLLAASIPARGGQHVVEAGTGAGAGLLCLAARVPGIIGWGIERNLTLAALAQANANANGFATLTVTEADLLDLPPRPHGPPIDHAMANPPWHEADSSAAPDSMRDDAKRRRPGLLAAWAQALAVRLRHHGTLTFVVAASLTAEAIVAFGAAGCGSLAVQPLWPAPGQAARIVLLRGVRGGRGGSRILPGLVLHDGPQRYSDAALAFLRDGAALPF